MDSSPGVLLVGDKKITAECAEDTESGKREDVSGEDVFAKTPSPDPSPKTPIWLAVEPHFCGRPWRCGFAMSGKSSGLSLQLRSS